MTIDAFNNLSYSKEFQLHLTKRFRDQNSFKSPISDFGIGVTSP